MATQNHIHLSDTLTEDAELAPDRKWKVLIREPEVQFWATVDPTLTGSSRRHVLTQSGSVVVKRNFNYLLMLRDEGMDTAEELFEILVGFAGLEVYLVDSVHTDDGTDHTAYIRTMVLTEIGKPKPGNQALEFYTVPIVLREMS